LSYPVYLQVQAKNRLVYGALLSIWIIVPAFATVMGCLMTDIVNGMCIPWGVYASYAAEKAMTSVMVCFSFLVPAILMVLCYARIVYKIRNKVTSVSDDCPAQCFEPEASLRELGSL